MNIFKNANLKYFNSFRLNIFAKYLIELTDKSQIPEIAELIKKQNYIFLGEGTNILFTKDFDGYVVLNKIKGIEKYNETNDYIILKVYSGQNWDQFVQYTIENNYYGCENLSGIPGTVGAAPVQNIGAYGTEVKDIILSVQIFDIQNKTYTELNNKQCHFEYRNSIFKQKLKKNLFITSVKFLLKKTPNFNLSYKGVKQEIRKIGEVNLKNIRKAILNIRKRKLPDHNKIGNAGSFFKNPIISNQKLKILQKKYPQIPFYNLPDNKIKIPAAWLIDKAGCKGHKIGGAMIYPSQPLVIINTGNATPNDIITLAKYIQKKVTQKFNILLEPEVNFL